MNEAQGSTHNSLPGTDPHGHFMKRLYPMREFWRLLEDLLTSSRDMRGARKKGLLTSQFGERIMMAVTEVNGCRYCSYFHTKVALQAGLERDEILATLAGDFAHAPREELAALCYAQHYAESGGKLDADANHSLMDEYGPERGRAILGYIRAIMVGNAWGNAFDSLLFRLRGKPTHGMTLAGELGVLLGPIGMMPLIVLGRVLRR